MNIEEVLKYIDKRIENLKIDHTAYQESYQKHAKFYNIEEASKNYRWMLEAQSMIVELDILKEKILGEGE